MNNIPVKMARLVLVGVLVAMALGIAFIGAGTPSIAHGASALSDGCQALNDDFFDDFYNGADVSNPSGLSLFAGEIITITARPDDAVQGQVIELVGDSSTLATKSAESSSATLTYIVPVDVSYNRIGWQLNSSISANWTVSCTGAPSEDEEEDTAEPQPGCDVLYDLPSYAVVGRITDNVVAEWEPGHDTQTIFTIGKTLWVLGINSAGTHYKVLYSCTELWIPVEAMGPNYDEVWNGTPLPTVVVD